MKPLAPVTTIFTLSSSCDALAQVPAPGSPGSPGLVPGWVYGGS